MSKNKTQPTKYKSVGSGLFLQIDEKLLSYSDLEAEAIDLYTKHGFRTYVIPKYPIFYNLSDLGKIEHQKDVVKGIKALNTDGKPYIVIELTLGNDLDFKGEVLLISDGSRSLSDKERDNIKSTIEETFHVGTDTNLNVTEAADAIDYFRFMLDDDADYVPTTPDLSSIGLQDVRSMTVAQVYNTGVLGTLNDAMAKYNFFIDRKQDPNHAADLKIVKDRWLPFKNWYICQNIDNANVIDGDATLNSITSNVNDINNWRSLDKSIVKNFESDVKEAYDNFLKDFDLTFTKKSQNAQVNNTYFKNKFDTDIVRPISWTKSYKN